jgi:5-methylcytosine-specific restriction endonuclease McrBC regulatory subunit McrC
MRTTDNNMGHCLLANEDDTVNLSKIANSKISDIKLDEHPNLLVFPHLWNMHNDNLHKSSIFSLSGKMLTTYNIMGFIGVNDTELTIASRFAEENKSDYFLHYMLQKVLAINMVNLDIGSEKENIQDFLPYFFPAFLKNALSQGLYKQYRRNEYNDANVKGTIDVGRHIRINTPFTGKIAYTMREHAYDNALTQLIRHTIEYLRTRPMGNTLLTNEPDIRANVSQIEFATPSYMKSNLQKIIHENRKPINHPYFTEYRPLQMLCIKILRQEKITFGNEKDKIHGLLFDGAWLWEEYLNKVFETTHFSIEHPKNKIGHGRDYLFTDGQRIYPDFIKRKNKSKYADYIADAKYKHVDKKEDENGGKRDDYYQLITYMYRYKSNKGFLLFPYNGRENLYWRKREIVTVEAEESRNVQELGLKIPQLSGSFNSFCVEMKESENRFVEQMQLILQEIKE